MIRGVLFDIGEVLVRSPSREAWLEPWPRRLGLAPEEFARRFAELEAMGGEAGAGFSVGAVSERAYRERAVQVLGLSDTQDGADPDAWMASLWDWYCGALDAELFAYAKALRGKGLRGKGLRVGTLSNSFDGARREEQRRFGFEDAFDVLVYSHEVGLAKPDPEVFLVAAQRLGLPPDQVVFVDVVPGNIEGARACGLHAVLHVDTPSTLAALRSLLGV